MKFLPTLSFILLLITTQSHAQAKATKIDPCKIYGTLFIETQNKGLAQFKIFLEENESFADLSVYKQTNKFFADRSGQWAFVNDRAQANYIVYIETVKAFADFSVFYTDNEAFAGCKQ